MMFQLSQRFVLYTHTFLERKLCIEGRHTLSGQGCRKTLLQVYLKYVSTCL